MPNEYSSWKQVSPSKSSKKSSLASLAIVLIVVSGVFIYLIYPRTSPNIYGHSISVTQYGYPLPNLMSTNITEISSRAVDRGLLPLVEVGSQGQRIDSAKNVEQSINLVSSDTRLKNTTLLLHLRCHSALQVREDGELDCELLVGESQFNHFYLSDVLKFLSQSHAKDIVILADFGGLQSIPSLGVFSNPASLAVRHACEVARKNHTQGPEIWLITPMADGQVPLSDRRGISLFQAACAEALIPSDNDMKVTLRSFYENLVKYTYTASQGTQIPQLINASRHSESITPEAQALWRAADEVKLGVRSRSRVASANKANQLPEEPPQEDPNSTQPPIRPVNWKTSSTLQDEGASESETTNTALNAAPQKDVSIPTDTMQEAKRPTDLWGYVDYIRNSPSSDRWEWNPIDFQPFQWRLFLEKEAQDVLDSPMGDLIKVDPKRVPERFLEIPNFQERRFWENAALLPADQRSEWLKIRSEYRKFSIAVSELSFWRQLLSKLPLNRVPFQRYTPESWESESVWRNALESSLTNATEFRNRIPRINNDSIIESWNRVSNVNTQGDVTKGLYYLLDQLINKLLNSSSWSWIDESRATLLLKSPLLTSTQRKLIATRLISQTLEIKEADWNAPDISLSNVLSSNGDIARSQEIVSRDVRHNLLINSLLEKLYTNQPTQNPNTLPNDTPSLVAVGKKSANHIQIFTNDFRSASSIDQWLYLSTIELNSDVSTILNPATTKSGASIGYLRYPTNVRVKRILPPNDRYIALSRSPSKSTVISLPISFLDELSDPIEDCRIRWRLGSGAPKPSIALTVEGKSFPPNTFVSLPVKNRSAKVEVRWDGKIPVNDDETVIFETEESTSQVKLPLFVNADSIDVIFEAPSSIPQLRPKQNQASSIPNVTLVGPLVEETSSPYSIFLRNKTNSARHVLLKFYADSHQHPYNLIAQSASLTLPAFEGGKTVKLPVEFAEAVLSPELAKKIVALSGDRQKPQLLYCVVEEFDRPWQTPPATGGTPSAPKLVRQHTSLVNIREIPIGEMIEVSFDADLNVGVSPTLEIRSTEFLKNAFSPSKVAIQLESLVSERNELKPSISRPNFELLDLSKPVTASLPAMKAEQVYTFAISVGKYPRAVFLTMDNNALRKLVHSTFQSRINQSTLRLSPIFNNLPADTLVPEFGILHQLYGGIEKTENLENRSFVFPSWQNGLDLGRNRSAIKVQGNFDVPNGDYVHWELTDMTVPQQENRNSIEGRWPDRNYIPRVSIAGNVLKLGFDVSELDREIDISKIDRENSSEWELSLRSGNVANSQVVTQRFILDRTPPKAKARLSVDGRSYVTVYLDSDNIELQVDASDPIPASSGVANCVFVLSRSRDRNNNAIIGNLDIPISYQANKLKGSLSGSKLQSLNLVNGADYWIHATTIDRAGNTQEDNVPLKVTWRNLQSPDAGSISQ